MEAATTTTTTTAKHYNKSSKLQNNHHRSTERRGTYRNQIGETQASASNNVKVQKQTAKQAKAAAQRAAAVAAYTATLESGSGGGNKAAGGSAKDPLAISNDAASPVQSSGSKAARTKEAREQKTIAKSDTEVAAARSDSATIDAISTNVAASSSSSNTNQKHSDNSNSSSISKHNFTLSQNEVTRKSEKQQEISGISSNNGDIQVAQATEKNKPAQTVTPANTTTTVVATATPIADSNTWNNSRYLHKKFKRLASTTDVDSLVADSQSVNAAGSSASSDAGSEAPQTRTASLSSSASTSSISPPPATTPTPAVATHSHAQSTSAAVSLQNAIAATGLTNGHAHAEAIAQPSHNNNNSVNSVKYSGAIATNTSGKIESNNNTSPLSLENHSGVGEQAQNSAQQYLEAEQLPQTMLHMFESQQSGSSTSNAVGAAAANSGRYVCPYCNLNCTKPSVLQKHIRAHTNERPYPCDICGIAFKTNSNYYKHCRSRSHAARKRGIEVPIGADDGLFGGSDQEGDPELSNSSSDVVSRTASPLDDLSSVSSPAVASAIAPSSGTANTFSPQQLQQLQQQQQKQTQLQQQQQLALAMQQQQQQAASAQPPHLALPSTPSPSSISSSKSAYLQQPTQQTPQQLPLGSPAAGTLPPSTPNANATTITPAVTTALPKQIGASAEHKPYKPKFHNAALYATTKEAAAAAAAAVAAGIPPGLLQPLSQPQPPPPPPAQQLPQGMLPAAHSAMLPQVPPTAPVPAPQNVSHHPSLSPSTQVKLNNHINTHQMQLQMQHQQQQQHHQQTPLYVAASLGANMPLHHAAAAMSPKSAAQRPDMVNAAAVAAANMGYLAAPRMIYPGAMDFPPEALHMMMPESRQKLHYQVQQYKWLEQELQQHLHKLSQQQQQQQQLQHLQTQPPPPLPPQTQAPSSNQPTILKPTATMPLHPRATSATSGNAHHAVSTSNAASHLGLQAAPQTPLQYLANTAASQQPVMGGSNVSGATNNTTASISSGLLHSNISNAAASGANKVADLVQEHISKLISQNEAIVENKAVLLQKKYPKGINRSRSFNNNNSSTSGSSASTANNSGSGSVSLVSTTAAVGSESAATNARLAQAIVQKQQQQQLQQQLQQQQHYQQQFQQQLMAGTQALQMPPPTQQQQHQQHFAQLRLEEQHQQHLQLQQQQQHMQPNGISKHLTAPAATKVGSTIAHASPAVHSQQQPLSTAAYRQPSSSGPPTLPPHEPQRPTPSPTMAQTTGLSSHNKDIMSAIQQRSALAPDCTALSSTNASTNALPLNLSAKPKARLEEPSDGVPSNSLSSTPSSTPRKRQSIENQISNSSNDGSTSSSVMVGPPATAGSGAPNAKQPTNVSIIKNLLLNARGLAVPTGEGEDAVYNCPLCASTFRTAEDLQLHNSTYCQGASSAPISPVSSPSYRYFRSNSMTLNLPELKNSLYRSRDPLPLAKLAWYQLRTKPSSLVLSRLSASQAGSSKATTTTTTSATSTAPTSSTSSSSVASCVASPRSTPPTAPPATLSLPDPNIVRFIDAPLPSPGPLLGKTPLVDFGNTSESRKSEDVIITKMHEDRQFDGQTPAKRAKLTLDGGDPFVLASAPVSSGSLMGATSSKRLNINSISGGDMQMLSTAGSTDLSLTNKKEDRMRRFTSSGGCIIPISECSDVDKSPKMIRTPLLSGGSFQEVSPKPPKEKENKNSAALPFINSSAFAPKLGLSGLGLPTNGPQHFQFPINPITAFNPLTLPPLQSMQGSGEKIVPHVPGMPGPHSLTPQLPPPQHLQLPQPTPMLGGGRSLTPNRKKTPSPMLLSNNMSPKSLTLPANENLKSLSPFGGVQNVPSEFERAPPPPGMRTARNWNQNSAAGSSLKPSSTSNSLDVPKKPFNFTRMADNVSPRKAGSINAPKSSPPETEVRYFNFDHLTKDGESSGNRASGNSALTPLHVEISASVSAPTPSSGVSEPTDAQTKKNKFLRPTSLPLKPGTFTPKRHHGITPTANTLPLISPETPRPSKSCVQLYLNGHAYTYLGLKCSTKMFYCTVNCPQPSYVAGAQKLSMYSVWQVCAENNPHPLGFKPKVVMSLYDSRQKTSPNTMAGTNKLPYSLVVSQQTVMTPFENSQGQYQHHQLRQISLNTNTSEGSEQSKKASAGSSASSSGSTGSVEGGSKKDSSASQMLVGGYESHEDYTYIRGRGRGRYVCSECGIRCKKPSMLKKHIRTHTDVRPYTCKHCNFSFKTKGNLTKHMQSKTHFKKCLELGINPGPMPANGEFLEPEPEFDQQSTTSAGGRTSSIPGESDSEDYSDNESESSGRHTDESKSRLLEHEAARGLLSLSMTPPIGQSVSPRPKSESYSYHLGERVGEPSAISFAGQMSASVTTTVTAITSTTTSSTHPIGIKRVISFSSPKPPFDYQKQEQYYSNPEESKPKYSSIATTASYESAPIDLTKPRAAVNPTPSPAVPATTSATPRVTIEEYNPSKVVPLAGPPKQTQAQIRDVIFGSSNNESGFLKTLISVSDKVRSSTEMLENYKNGDELSQAYQYHKAFQYHKIKQIQMNRSFPDPINVGAINQSLASTPTMSTVSVTSAGASAALTTTASASSAMRISESITNTAVVENVSHGIAHTLEATEVVRSNVANKIVHTPGVNVDNEGPREMSTADLQVPAIEASVAPAEEEKNVHNAITPSASVSNKSSAQKAPHNKKVVSAKSSSTLPCKSSDEGEDSECISDQEQSAAGHTSKASLNASNAASAAQATEPHNAKLPAVVAQPGTTDFTGVLSAPGRTVVVGEDGLKKSGNNEIQPVYPRVRMSPDGRPVCKVCAKTFQTQGQLSLHMNIHYMERKFRCEPCGVSFRTQGHLQKHERAEAHKNKVMMTSTFGVPTTSNPRPFECTDCKIAFRIHGHLAKHLRSKTHVQKLECLQKLPFGTYAEIERAGISLTEIDTSDCENSLISLKTLAQKLIEKDPNKLGSYTTPSGMGGISGSGGAVVGSGASLADTTNANTNHSAIVSQDSASEDDFSAATIAAATAIASLDNDSAASTPKRANSTSEDEAIVSGLNNNLKRRLPGNFSNGEESDNPADGAVGIGGGGSEKRTRVSSLSSIGAASATAAVGSPASIASSNASSNN
ncbi:PREDICTED: mucin-19 isoform X1 [Rhagoletis zephyria]|uniref:mucin-19 isoform X1 n=1 Tax=Rhagoletis zephyria TaxID=28612 RepID=UPI0008119092|nr:PREDICTED: mucin-19 isoform X1 [Rhagoletis zephyria]XP_017464425.1 PREDICTED: mucin-19 isoform X1 [Rhagoletis zephyria]XP_017464432.1 PREDICTED: mucin-19 isoform X1 [Rhagoletis zephyria]XP_017464438.1 PREDICTED: mucin-19 isoform X1 [Rhagoletis zephyria]